MILFLACADDSEDAVRPRPRRDRDSAPERDADTATDTDPDPDTEPTGTLGALRQAGTTSAIDAWPTVNYRGVDTAWNTDAGVFLAVYGNAPIGGAFLSAEGAQIGSGFLLTGEAYDGANWTQNPRVASGDDGFLVTWHAEAGATAAPRARLVRFADGGPAFDGGVQGLADGGAQQESPIAVAWSPDAREYLAVWAANGLYARRLDASGVPLGEPTLLTAAGVWVEMPAVVYHPGCRCFVATCMQESNGGARVLRLRLDATTLLGTIDLTGTVDFAKVTDIELDAARDEVVATWYEVRGGVAGFAAQRFGADGAATSEAVTVFAPHASYDGYDLAYNPVTGTSLAAFHGDVAAPVVAELAVDLTDGDAMSLEGGGATYGFYLPRVVAHPTEPAWLVLGAPDYTSVAMGRVVRE